MHRILPTDSSLAPHELFRLESTCATDYAHTLLIYSIVLIVLLYGPVYLNIGDDLYLYASLLDKNLLYFNVQTCYYEMYCIVLTCYYYYYYIYVEFIDIVIYCCGKEMTKTKQKIQVIQFCV
jgi:hypothetical protein